MSDNKAKVATFLLGAAKLEILTGKKETGMRREIGFIDLALIKIGAEHMDEVVAVFEDLKAGRIKPENVEQLVLEKGPPREKPSSIGIGRPMSDEEYERLKAEAEEAE